jgi:hypothetical protein
MTVASVMGRQSSQSKLSLDTGADVPGQCHLLFVLLAPSSPGLHLLRSPCDVAIALDCSSMRDRALRVFGHVVELNSWLSVYRCRLARVRSAADAAVTERRQ